MLMTFIAPVLTGLAVLYWCHTLQIEATGGFWNRMVSSLLFADDVVLLASSRWDLQPAFGRFAALCNALGWESPRQYWLGGHGFWPEKGSLPCPGGWRDLVCEGKDGAWDWQANWCNLHSSAVSLLDRGGKITTKSKGETHDLLVSLCWLWSWTLRSEWKDKIADTSGRNKFPPWGCWANPHRHSEKLSQLEGVLSRSAAPLLQKESPEMTRAPVLDVPSTPP